MDLGSRVVTQQIPSVCEWQEQHCWLLGTQKNAKCLREASDSGNLGKWMGGCSPLEAKEPLQPIEHGLWVAGGKGKMGLALLLGL